MNIVVVSTPFTDSDGEREAFVFELEAGDVLESEVDDLGGLNLFIGERVLARFAGGQWSHVHTEPADA